MKKRTFLRISALIMTLLMTVSTLVLWTNAEQKEVYDEEYCDILYEDGVFTVELDAGKLIAMVKSGNVSKESLKQILPEGIYEFISTRSKKSYVDLLVNLVESDVLTYDELLKIFKNDEETLSNYINFEFLADIYDIRALLTEDVLTGMLNDGVLDDLFNSQAFKDAFPTVEITTYAAAVEELGGYGVLASAIKNNEELGDLIPTKEIWNRGDIVAFLRTAGGTKLNQKSRQVVTQVLLGEVNTAKLNGEEVYSNYELDHNKMQTVVVDNLPSVEEIAAMNAGDALLSYTVETTGDNIDMEFGLEVVLTGDMSEFKQYAQKLVGVLEYAVDAENVITVDVNVPAKFIELYNKMLETEKLTDEERLLVLGVYTLGAEEAVAELKGEEFDKVLGKLAESGITGTGKIEDLKNEIYRARDIFAKLVVKTDTYGVFENIDAFYLGNGEFGGEVVEVTTLAAIADNIRPRFAQIDQVLDWLKQEDHVTDVKFNVQIDGFYRVRFFDATGACAYLTYLPEGADLALVYGASELTGLGEYGWEDADGNTYTAMPSADIDLIQSGEPHSHQFGDWQYDENGHWKECSCGAKSEEGAHEFGEWVEVTPAGKNTSGLKKRTCYCGYEETATIPPTGSVDVVALVVIAAVALLGTGVTVVAFRKKKEN